MKIVKTYESFREFDVDFVMSKIRHHFSDDVVKKMVDDEIDAWVDDSNLTGSSTKKDWYIELGVGAVEEIISDQIFDWYENEFADIEISDEQKKELIKKIVSTYDTLQH